MLLSRCKAPNSLAAPTQHPRTFLACFLDLPRTSRCRSPSPAAAMVAGAAPAPLSPAAEAARPSWAVTARTSAFAAPVRRNSGFTGASPRATLSAGAAAAGGAAAAAADTAVAAWALLAAGSLPIPANRLRAAAPLSPWAGAERAGVASAGCRAMRGSLLSAACVGYGVRVFYNWCRGVCRSPSDVREGTVVRWRRRQWRRTAAAQHLCAQNVKTRSRSVGATFASTLSDTQRLCQATAPVGLPRDCSIDCHVGPVHTRVTGTCGVAAEVASTSVAINSASRSRARCRLGTAAPKQTILLCMLRHSAMFR